MPIELMACIFQLAAEFNSTRYPVIVSHVCRSWRDLALNTSSLWTNINIRTPCCSALGPVQDLCRASAFASRSSWRALNIKMEMVYHHRQSRPQIQSHVGRFLAGVNLIFGVRDRVKTLDIHSNRYAASAIVSQLIPHGLPMLERFRITVGQGYFPTGWEVVIPPSWSIRRWIKRMRSLRLRVRKHGMHALLPRLKEVNLSAALAFWSFWAITNLTSLTIDCIPSRFQVCFPDLRHILMQNENSLENLVLQASIDFSSEVPSSIVLPKLQQLHFGFVSQYEAIEVLQALEAPSLKSLDLRDIPSIQYFQYCRSGSDFPFQPLIHGHPSLHMGECYDSSMLLYSLCVSPPAWLAQIESLTLASLYLVLTKDTSWFDDVLTHSVSPLFICPARLMQQMTSLKTLTLHDPDRFFLKGLNFPVPVPGTETDAQPSWTYPGSQLSNMTMTHVGYEDLRAISQHQNRNCALSRSSPRNGGEAARLSTARTGHPRGRPAYLRTGSKDWRI
ncbi:hypothetical protein BU15DRAFT_72864 [Melanogaster broomeanus]|nr:hypothetical protein BU15DRAFT_72864 [Melanogaster broomeanus]